MAGAAARSWRFGVQRGAHLAADDHFLVDWAHFVGALHLDVIGVLFARDHLEGSLLHLPRASKEC